MVEVTIQKLFILITLSISLIIFTSLPSIADITDIDNDVVANVSFSDGAGEDDRGVNVVDISWNATYSGYLYFFAYTTYESIGTTVNAMSGTSEKVNLGIMDDTAYGGYTLTGWRMGYVTQGTIYNISGSVYEPGTDICDDGPTGFYKSTDGTSYSGGSTGHVIGLSPGGYHPCALDYFPLTFLVIEAPPPVTPTPTPTPTPIETVTEPPIYIPPPVTTPTPTDNDDDNETITPVDIIIEEILELLPDEILELLPEEIVKNIEETIKFILTPFNWLLLLFAYVGTFLGKYITVTRDDEILIDTALYGTIAWIIVLTVNLFVPIINVDKFIAMFIFMFVGFIIAALANINTQPKKKSRRR